MKIVQVLPVQGTLGFSLSGAEKQVFRLASGLVSESVSSHILILGDEFAQDMSEAINDLKSQGVTVHNISWQKVQDPSSLLALRKKLKEINADLVHAHLIPAELAVPWLEGKAKVLVTLHNDDPERLTGFKKTIHKLSLSKYDAILCISNNVAGYLQQFNLDSTPCKVIEYGLDEGVLQARDQVRKTLNLQNDEFAMVCLARLVEQKDHATLLNAFAEAKKSHSGCKLYLYGAGPLEASLKQQAESLGVSEHVCFMGHDPKAASLLAGFDLFVLSSLWEGLGLVLVEAMMAHCPIVATKAGAIEDVLDDEYRHYLVEIKDEKAFAEQMVKCMQKPMPGGTLNDIAERAKARYSYSRYLSEHMTIYQNLLS